MYANINTSEHNGMDSIKKNFEGWYHLNYTYIYSIHTFDKIHPVTIHYL
jgi:hypothetical protein